MADIKAALEAKRERLVARVMAAELDPKIYSADKRQVASLERIADALELLALARVVSDPA
jgi:hypothetical protein